MTRGRKTDPRPYVSEAAQFDEPPSTSFFATTAIGMVALALATGIIIGFAVLLVMNLSSWLTALLWNGASGQMPTPWFPLVVCTLGGALIGIWTWRSGDRVKPLEEVMTEFKATGSYRINGPWKPVVSFLLPLVFGGSIGFEAGITGLATAGCCWIRDRLKAAGLRAGSVADVTIAASISAIFGTPLAGIVAGAESAPADGESVLEEPNVNDYNMRRSAKIVLYTAAAFGAFGGIALFSQLFGASGGLPRFDPISATRTDLLWIIPCLIAAYAMTLVFHGSARLFKGLAARLGNGAAGIIGAPVVAGIILGAIAMVFPLALFPGEAQSEQLIETWGSMGIVALLGTGLLKAFVTPMCLNMGWVGGSFFPSIFAGVAAGYGLAALTGVDAMLMVTVTTTAFLAGVTRKPLLTLAVLFLCFPAQGLLWMGLAAVIGASLPIPNALTSDNSKRSELS